jgi:hypothetical protein
MRQAASSLAARGAANPDALAAYLSRRVLEFAPDNEEFGGQGNIGTCPNCGYSGRMEGGSAEALRTPAPSTGYVRNGAPLTVRGAGSGVGPGLANEDGGIELARPGGMRTRYPVSSPQDILVTREPGGSAVIRHRRGGGEIGKIMRSELGWQGEISGRQLKPHAQSGQALNELLSTWNAGTTTMDHAGSFQNPVQPQPTQTALMEQMGIPAIRLATPSTSTSDGPRVTSSSSSDDPDDGKSSGLTPKGKAIKQKLLAKGWPDAKADAFARRAQSFGGSK